MHNYSKDNFTLEQADTKNSIAEDSITILQYNNL